MAGRILIADNVATNRIVLKVKLATACYEVRQVETAGELLQHATKHRPDLILMDAGLPDADSFQTCRALKETLETEAIPIVMMTDRFDRDIRLKALRSGAEDILSKPLDEPTLLARVRNILRAHGMEEELRRRQGTAAEFGFHEAQSDFAGNAKFLIVQNKPKPAHKLLRAIQDFKIGNAVIVDQKRILEEIGQQNLRPDVIVVPAELEHEKNCLTLVAELRSRAQTRHSAIIIEHGATEREIAISSLDIGANDLVHENSHTEEILHRVATQLDRKRTADQLRMTLENGLKLAVTDPLTGLFNRRYALPHMSRISTKSKETCNPFAVMVLDLDHFKKINDTHGHAAGDAVLKEIALRLKNNLRSVDLICRVGGEEFLVVMPDTDLTAARKTAERLRHVTEANAVTVGQDTPDIWVTLSIGVSMGGNGDQAAMPVEKIYDRADRALLGAKSHGKNQVIFSQPST